jgi:uncharacterized phiE125 gp8 family phage protein
MQPLLSLVTPPAVEPVTLTEAKLHCRVEVANTYNDPLITSLIVVAREWVEKELDRSIIDTTWDWELPGFPGRLWLDDWRALERPISNVINGLILPRPRLRSVTWLKYVDSAGTVQTLTAGTDYEVKAPTQGPGFVYPSYGKSWPSPRSLPDAVRIRFVAGYGAAASSVPECVKAGMKLLVGHWFENREQVVSGTITKEIEMGVQAVISPENWGAYG